MRFAATVVVNDEEREQLLAWSRGRSTPHRLVLRSKIVLMAADGLQNKKIAESLHVRPKVVTRWRNRFDSEGVLRPFERAQMHYIGRAMVTKGWLDPSSLPPADRLHVELRGRAHDLLSPLTAPADTTEPASSAEAPDGATPTN